MQGILGSNRKSLRARNSYSNKEYIEVVINKNIQRTNNKTKINILQSCFSACGFQTAMTVKEISTENLIVIQEEADAVEKKLKDLEARKLIKPVETEHIRKLLFGDMYADIGNGSNFIFNIGEKIIINEIVKFVKQKIDELGYNYFSTCSNNTSLENNTEMTVLGDLFISIDYGSDKMVKKKKPKINKTKKQEKTRKADNCSVRDDQSHRSDIAIIHLESIKTILKKSLYRRVLTILYEKIQASSAEKDIMIKNGVQSIEEDFDKNRIKINVTEEDINGIICNSDNMMTRNISATIMCYCAPKQNPAVVTVNFRSSEKFRKLISSGGEIDANSVSETFIAFQHNFKRHLLTHSKTSNTSSPNIEEPSKNFL